MTGGPHARAHWHDAYDAQMALVKWYGTVGGHRWMRGSMQASVENHGARLGAETEALIGTLYDAEMGRLIDCDPIYVSEEMCDVIDAARPSFRPEPLLETDLVTPRGFLWWARPLEMVDRYDLPLSVHAVSWSQQYGLKPEKEEEYLREILDRDHFAQYGDRLRPSEMAELVERGIVTQPGVAITLYAERNHYLDVTQGWKRRMDDPSYSIPPSVYPETASVPVVPFHLTPWYYGMSFDGNEVDEAEMPTGAEDWWTLVQTTLRLMQQRISARSFHRPHRAHRREAKARGLIHEPEVVVVRLRREQADSHGEPMGEANYSHRFIVGGHWRNQPYPSEGVTRQIWISPYVKGDPSLPLIVRPRRVFQWER